MTIQEERPPGGGDWLGNARVYERGRVSCLNRAEQLERDGHTEEAAEWRARAAMDEHARDRAQRDEERRAMNRSLASRRRYHRATPQEEPHGHQG